ncbi:hypothetical protein C0J45_11525 [Silurus meridionalis]|nr:hypothetical protein C0J45_11525 [Silurus meridionalis]
MEMFRRDDKNRVVELRFPNNGSIGEGSFKRKSKSSPYGDNDDNNYETMAMIHQQMYGPGCSYYNFAYCKPPRDDLEDKTPVVQPPAKTTRIDSSYVESPAMMSERSGGPSKAVTYKPKSSVTKGSRKRQRMFSRDGETVTKPPRDNLEEQDVTPVVQPPAKTTRIDSSYVEPPVMMSECSGGTSETFTNQPKSSVTTEHLKHKCKSPHHGDNDDKYETMAMICQQMYGPGGPYYNIANRKPPRDDLKDKTPVIQPPVMMSERSGGTSETVTNQPKFSVRTEHHKYKCKSPRHGDNDDINYETMAMICQQMYGPGGPYYNFANCKPPRDDLEDKNRVVQPPAMMSERSGGTSETLTKQPKSSVRTEHHKHKCKSPRHGDNDNNNYETMAMIRQQMYCPGGPYYNSTYRKPPRDDLEEQDVTPVVQPPAKTTMINSSYVEPPAMMSKRSGGTSETFTNKPKSSVTTEHLKHKCKCPHHGDNDDKYENMAMICQQMYGPGSPYYNFANRKPPRDDLEDETPVVQPPAKTITIDSSYVESPANMSERSGGPSEAVTNKPKSSVTKGSRKRQRKSSRDGETVTKPPRVKKDKTPVKKSPAKPSKVDSSHVEAPVVLEHSGDTSAKSSVTDGSRKRRHKSSRDGETVTKPPRVKKDKTPVKKSPAKPSEVDSSHVEAPVVLEHSDDTSAKSSVTDGSRKRRCKSSRDGKTVTKPPRDDLEDKTPVKKLPAKPSKVDSSHVEAPAVSEHSGDTSESKLFTSQAKSSVTDGSRKRRRKSPNDGNTALKVLGMMIHKKLYGPGGRYHDLVKHKRPRGEDKDKKKDSSKRAKKFCSSQDRSDTQPRAQGKGKTKKQMKSAEGDGGAETRSSQTTEPTLSEEQTGEHPNVETRRCTFNPRPVLHRNNMLAEELEKQKKNSKLLLLLTITQDLEM